MSLRDLCRVLCLLCLAQIVLWFCPDDVSAAQEKYAVVIGISQYRDRDIPNLQLAAKDARDFHAFLVDPSGGDFKKDHVRLLLDEQASLKNIKKELGIFLSRRAGEEDLVVIYFAGHGAPETDMSGRADDGFAKYLIPHDADSSMLYATALEMAELEKVFQRIVSRRLVCFLDCCYSGATGSRSFTALSFQGRGVQLSDVFFHRLVPEGTGRVLLTASKANQVAMELPEMGNGLFTHYLLRALRGEGDLNRDGYITVQEIYDFTEERVSRTSRLHGGNQRPQLIGSLTGRIVLARHGGVPEAPPPEAMIGSAEKQGILGTELQRLRRLEEEILQLRQKLTKGGVGSSVEKGPRGAPPESLRDEPRLIVVKPGAGGGQETSSGAASPSSQTQPSPDGKSPLKVVKQPAQKKSVPAGGGAIPRSGPQLLPAKPDTAQANQADRGGNAEADLLRKKLERAEEEKTEVERKIIRIKASSPASWGK